MRAVNIAPFWTYPDTLAKRKKRLKLADFNPITLAKKGINAALDKAEGNSQAGTQGNTTSNAVVPTESDSTAVDAVPVERGIWIDASQVLDSGNAAKRTEEFRRIVQTFDEDRQDKLAWLVGKFFTCSAYLLPLAIGWYAGQALGDTLQGPLNWHNNTNVFAHLISTGLEIAIPMLGYTVAIAFKRASKDRSQATACAILLLVFLAMATGNALTQEVLLYDSLPQATLGQQVAVWFRSFGPSIVDVLCTVFIAIVGVRNLKKYLADAREKIHAVREVSAVHIEMDKASLQAAIDKQNAIQDMQSKAKRADTWNQIEGMQAEAMIENARRNMLGDGEHGGYRRSRY